MPGRSTLINFVLIVIVLVQAWMLVERSGRDATAGNGGASSASADSTIAAPGAPGGDPLASAVMDRLQRIDARLAALEAGVRRPPEAVQAIQAPDRIDPRTIAAADRRLAELLPDTDIDREDWVRWQTTLAGLPAAEQFALSAAFSRAVNEQRIRPRF